MEIDMELLNVAMLNVPRHVTPQVFSEWVQLEVATVQARKSNEQDLFVIRLYLLKELVSGLSEKEVGTVFDDVIETYGNILQIKVFVVDEPLSQEQMSEIMEGIVEMVFEDSNDNPSATRH